MPAYGISIEELVVFHKESGLDRLQQAGGVQAIAKRLGVDLATGIQTSEVKDRQHVFGENIVPEKPMRSYLSYIKDALGDFTIRLLCVCAVISIAIGVAQNEQHEGLGWLEGTAILATVFIVCNIQAVQDWTKERSFRKLNADVNRLTIPVLRDGKMTEVIRYEIVVGDVVAVGIGDILEADGILIKGEDVEVDESALTGEPEDIKKNAADAPFLYSGTALKNGSGYFLVTAVGVYSQAGKITALIRGQKVALGGNQEEAPVEAKSRPSAEGPAEGGGGGRNSLSKVSTVVVVEGADMSDPRAEHQEEAEGGDEDEEEDSSVLRQKLDAMVGRIAYFAFGSAGIASIVMLARYIIVSFIVKKKAWEWGADGTALLEAITTGIAIVVVAVPEGLPLAVTLALSLSMKKMQKDNNLVKHLDATETMGSATTICSDKTGTLTQNRMTVVRAFVGGKEFAGEHGLDKTCGKVTKASGALSKAVQEAIVENICATKAQGTEIVWEPAKNAWDQRGNKTDCALLAWVDDLDIKYNEVRQQPHFWHTDGEGNKVFGLKSFTFNSARKRAGVVLPRTSDKTGPCRVYVKGASEIVLKLCTSEVQLDGTTAPLSDERREVIFSDVVEKFAGAAMRTIALAYREFKEPPDWDAEVDEAESLALTGLKAKTLQVETNLVFLGVMGIHDPLREGVPAAVAKCNQAGVDVRMVTGDHKATAIAIAKECGILRRGVDYLDQPGEPLTHIYTALTGEEFRNKVLTKGQIDQDAFDEIWPFLRVLARSSPEDKHTLVTGIMESELYKTQVGKDLGLFPDRQIVAVTGDGTNDAPALRRADVGFAMKIAGTRVAQDAADILLLDDNFESVVKACMWGRNVYDSIVKFLQFQLTVNVSAVTISVVGAVVLQHPPLGVIQMLWVNLIMDSLGALALASEPPSDALLRRKPYGKNRGLLAYEMFFTIFGQSAYQLTVLFAILFGGAGPDGPHDVTPEEVEAHVFVRGGFLNIESGNGRPQGVLTQHYTLIFNAFVFMQLGNWICCRKLHFERNPFEGLHKNTLFLGIWVCCIFVQVILVEVAAIGGASGRNVAFRTQALDGWMWGVTIGIGAFTFIWQQVLITLGTALRPWLASRRAEVYQGEEDDLPVSASTVGHAVDLEAEESTMEIAREDEATVNPGSGKRSLRSTTTCIIAARRMCSLKETGPVSNFGRVDDDDAHSYTGRSITSLASSRSSSSSFRLSQRSRSDRRTLKEFSSRNSLASRMMSHTRAVPTQVRLSMRNEMEIRAVTSKGSKGSK